MSATRQQAFDFLLHAYIQELILACFKNSSKAISPWATSSTSLTIASFLCKSTSQIWPRVNSETTQLTWSLFISCFQWRSLSASDFSSITNMFIYRRQERKLHPWTWTIKYMYIRNDYNLPSCSPSEVSEHTHRRHTVASGQGSFSVGSADHLSFVEAVSNIKAMKSFSASAVNTVVQV